MRINFTTASIKALKTDEPMCDVWDVRNPGFGMRVSRDGSKTWLLVYRKYGQHLKLTLGHFPQMSLSKARIEVAAARSLIAQGLDPGKVRADAIPSFEQLARMADLGGTSNPMPTLAQLTGRLKRSRPRHGRMPKTIENAGR